MRDVAKECYDACNIDAQSVIQPDFARGETLEGFQSVLIAANFLQKQGNICIQKICYENQSGQSPIEAIRFVRLR